MKAKFWSLCFASVMALVLTACSGIGPDRMAQNFSTYKVFGNHMVLQRNVPVVISGKADPGMFVKVEFAKLSRLAQADKNGEWSAEFPAMKAGGPYTMTVSGRDIKKNENFKDILIGEVWMCSGQSNMEMPVDSGRAFWRVQNCAQEVANADYPMIRLYNSSRSTSPTVRKSEPSGSGWELCSPASVKKFSAAGYFFGRELYKDLKVPIGLINASWGGTRIEPWIPETAYQKADRVKEIAMIASARKNVDSEKARIAVLKKKTAEKFNAWKKSFDGFDKEKTAEAAVWKYADYNDSAWTAAKLPGGFSDGADGVAWYRLTFDVPAKLAGKDAVLNLGAVDDCDETFFNGAKVGSTGIDVPNYWSRPRKYTVPGRLVKSGKNVIAVRVTDYFGDGGLMAPGSAFFVSGNEKISLAKGWKYRLEFAVDYRKIGPRPGIPETIASSSVQFPSTLFNSMIAPWLKYNIRGAIWYQGCGNAGNPDYYPLHKILIQGWRDEWKNPEMPFIVTQLSGFQRHLPKKRPDENSWKAIPANASFPYALTREIQAEMLKLPHTGLAVTIDRGDQFDIHPGNKQIVGKRLAREAERIVYGNKGITSGPRFESVKFDGSKAVVRFANTGKGLTTGDGKRPGAFAVAGADRKFFWADYSEIKGNDVIVSSVKVKSPKFVRYAWTQYRGDVNLYNQEGFPALPFRTDKPVYK